jgi:hypothetical protein
VPRAKGTDILGAPLWVKCVNHYLRPRLKINGVRIEADGEDGRAHPVPQRRRPGPRHLMSDGLP